MDLQCKECSKKMSDKNYAISRHVKQHNLELNSYIRKHYTLIGENIFEKCSFCDNEAPPTFKINHDNLTYEILYEKGYACNTLQCKSKISLDILGIEYNKKKYEKIGSRSDYLALLYGISKEDSKKMKYNQNANHFDNSLEGFIKIYGETEGNIKYDKRLNGINENSSKYTGNLINCNLKGFISKHGKEKGEILYKERCDKIAYSNTIDFYTEKYGEIEGKIRYKNKLKQTKISKKSIIVGNLLDKLKINYLTEENIGSKMVDYYLTDYKIVIEYFGDYWHCNPKKYESDFYHSRIKKTAAEIWQHNTERLNYIKDQVNSILIIWESSNIDIILLEKTLIDIKDIKTIIYI